MRTISLAVLCGLVAALAAAVAASAEPGTTTAAAAPSRPATSFPYRNGFVGRDDAAGDAQIDSRTGAGAADITRFTISNNRAGFVIFAITINQNSLFDGDYVLVFLDLDRNQGTGCDGDEVVLRSVGRGDAGAPQFELYVCRNGQLAATTNPSYQGQFDAPDRRVLFGLSRAALGVNRFNALAYTVWVPDEQSSFVDLAPDSQYLSYTLQPIPCSELIGRPGARGTYAVGGGSVVLVALRIVGLPARASITVRGAGRSERVRASRSGVANTRRFRGIRLRQGMIFSVSFSSQGCSVSARFRVSRSGRIR